MLRCVTFSALACALCSALGFGKVVALNSSVESFFLAMAALSATVLISSYDAYETQSVPTED